jgi:hypothetical protein
MFFLIRNLLIPLIKHNYLFSRFSDIASKQDWCEENILIKTYIVEDSVLLRGKRFVFLREHYYHKLNGSISHPYFITL